MAIGYVAGGGHVSYCAASHPAVARPHQVGQLPRQADCFQDRTAVQPLEQAVTRGGTAAL
ncbi:hypothetical protein [Streptomyces sp. NPDC001292]|uniref:hypothetical protein n=1 Tax=Streptomyces sp. NPDC001292 TaxID=3364558 RepID=UPI0036CB3B1F